MGVLAIVFNLCCPSKPIAECENWLSRSAQVPAVYISIHCTSCKHIRVMCREIDIRNCPCMPMKRVFDCSLGRIFWHVQVPYQRLLICCTDNPILPCSKRGPLHVCNKPRESMAKMARGVQRIIEVNNIEPIGTTESQSYFLRMPSHNFVELLRRKCNISSRWRDGSRSNLALHMN